MPGKGAFGSVRQLPSGRWQVRYRTLDSTRVAFPQTFARKAEALQLDVLKCPADEVLPSTGSVEACLKGSPNSLTASSGG